MTLRLPTDDGRLEPFTPSARPLTPMRPAAPWTRVAFAAAPVTIDPLRSRAPWTEPCAIDWDTTLAERRRLWSLGFAVAEAMDTAQRGMGLAWPSAQELISRSLAEARACADAPFGARVAAGAGTDQLAPGRGHTLDAVAAAYAEQVGFVEAEGGQAIVMASRALARAARGPDDYARVYGAVLGQAARPVILHWLGVAFDPELAGYWGSADTDEAMTSVLAIIAANAGQVDGIKVSLLDAEAEIRLRRRLPAGVRLYTGDDFDYPRLIEGDAEGYSDALLGVFDPIAPAASIALGRLSAGDLEGYRAILAPTLPLARKIFEAPTWAYKAGVVFLAWLDGRQNHFSMIGGLQSARGLPHYAALFRLADAAGLLADPDLAEARMRLWLGLHGVEP